jgi:hypothetical protein
VTIGFFHVDKGQTEHRQLAAKLIASARRHMPNVPIVHLTDLTTLGIPGVNEVVRSATTGRIALDVLDAYARCEGDWLLVDTDVLIQRDVRWIFGRKFDIAVATREGTLKPKEVGTKFMSAMPFNKGAVFSRSPAFWAAAAARLRELPAKRQAWMGDQQAMCDVIASERFVVQVLEARYNYPPKSRDENVNSQAILHFKGPRKAWMLERVA